MHDWLVDMLQCPACHGQLAWTIAGRRADRLEAADAVCRECGAGYPVRQGIGVFLTPDLPRNDLWEQVESGLGRYLREHPEVERLLTESPLEELNPADQLFRAFALEERGQYVQASAVAALARSGLYTPAYLACHDSQIRYLADRVRALAGPVVDLASGYCQLVEALAREPGPPVVATDFSLSVLRRARPRLEVLGLYHRVSLLVLDARRTPFKDQAVPALTTNLGLPNIEAPGALLQELRRIVSGSLLAIQHFYQEEDQANAAAVRDAGLAALLFRQSTLDSLTAAGWQVEVANVCRGPAQPTPRSALLPGAAVDALPVAEALLEWCTLIAH